MKFITACLLICMTVQNLYAQDLTPLERVETLGLETMEIGRVTLYFAPADRERAVELATLAEAAAAHFERELGVSFNFGLAALTPEHWFSEYPGVPYAIPWVSVSDHLLFVPSSLNEGLLVRGPTVLDDRRRINFVLLHEYGHLADKAYFLMRRDEDYDKVPWFREFLANYFAYAYVYTADPELAEAGKVMWRGVVEGYTPGVLSLEWGFMNDLPPGQLARTYAWYQNMLNLRAAEVYEEYGLDFIRDLNSELPWEETGEWTTEKLLPFLEQAAPGFQSWTYALPNYKRSHFAITPVTIIDVTNGLLLPDQTVLVEGNRIVTVGPAGKVAVPDDAEVVEAGGKYLIPGLWDMHAHTSSIPITRDIFFPLFIANGVTGIRSMFADCFESEQPDCMKEGFADPYPSIEDFKSWREEMEAGTLIGPRIVAGSAPLDGPDPDEQSTPFNPGTAEHGREHARILKERGVDFAKIYNFIPREAYFAFTDEASRLGLQFAGHVPEGVRASEASEAGQRSIEHAGFTNVGEECSAREDEIRRRIRAEFDSGEPQILPIWLDIVESYDAAKCAKVFDTFVKNGTWVAPTLVAGARADGEIESHWSEDPRLRYLPGEERELWNNMEEESDAMGVNTEQQQPLVHFQRDVTLAMHRAGVPLLAGSDAGTTGVFAGFGLHDELEVLVAIGLTEAEALRAATLEPARYLEAVDTQGTVEVGKVADLVLLDANPLEDISNTQRIHAVVADGRLYRRADLDQILANVEAMNQQHDE